MKTVSVGELKSRFSEILKSVNEGEEIVISFGKAHRKVAVLLPFERYGSRAKRQLGILEDKGTFSLAEDFALTDEALLSS